MPGALAQIAEQLNVSVSTVSRALAGKPGVSALKRRQIQELAEDLGLSPNLAASSLRTGRGRGLAILTQFHPTQIQSMRNDALFAAGQKQFGHVQVFVHTQGESLDRLIRLALTQKPQAIVICGLRGELTSATSTLLRNGQIPVTVMDGYIHGCDSVHIDRVKGVYQAARLLLISGCRRPLYFSRVTLQEPDDRVRGIVAAHASLGLETADIRLLPINASTSEQGYKLTITALERYPFDGLFCYSDELAIGALHALREVGIKVPEEVKVIGFDDLPIVKYLACPLTTVAQPVEDVAEAAVSLCAERDTDIAAPARRLDFPTGLIMRDTASVATNDLRIQIFESPQRVENRTEKN